MIDPQEFIIEVPSKTFVIGEYLALGGTASLVLTTEPTFTVKVSEDSRYGFHPDSPAGRAIEELHLDKVGFHFMDPHEGRGGFGRSTAEYLAVVLYDLIQKRGELEVAGELLNNLEDLVQQYKNHSGGEYEPSGADLVAQLRGGLCWYDGMNFTAETLTWPFPGYEILIFHTGKKLATHEHLADLKEKNFRELIPILVAARTALEQANLKVFCQSLDYYYDWLNEQGLSDPQVRSSVEALRQDERVLAAKGCGAMGVDTVLLVAESSAASDIIQSAKAHDFQWVSRLKNRHPGALIRRSV